MKIAMTRSVDPYINLATEEVMLRDESLEDVLLLYINDNTIVVGRNQNTNEEIVKDFVLDNNVKVIRRISGGGSVYHDSQNLNFSFITENKPDSFQKFLEPVIAFLRTLNLEAAFKGKNDLEVGGYKVSGNAQFKVGKRMFHHGTLLFNSDLSMLSKAIKPNSLKLESKSIKSNRARVANIKELMRDDIEMDEFVEKFIEFFENNFETSLLDLKGYKTKEIKKLAELRASDEWNYGKNPAFTFENSQRFDGGTITLKLNIVKDVIKGIAFYGDFLSSNKFEDVYKHFKGIKFETRAIEKAIDSIKDFESYFGKLEKRDIASLFNE